MITSQTMGLVAAGVSTAFIAAMPALWALDTSNLSRRTYQIAKLWLAMCAAAAAVLVVNFMFRVLCAAVFA